MERKKGKQYFWRLFLLLFTISAAIPTCSSGWILSYGLFGEIKTTTVLKESAEDVSDISPKFTIRERVKGENIWNLWFELWALAACLCLTACMYIFPKKDTIVSHKVRMDN